MLKQCQTGQRSKTRGMMYTQQLDKLPLGTVKAVEQALCGHSGLVRYAYIVHDQDLDDAGNKVAPHLHLMMEFKNPCYMSAIAKLFNDKEQYIENMTKKGKNGIANGFCYLVHQTRASREKHPYDPQEVTASFDYPEYLAQVSAQVQSSQYRGRKGAEKLVSDVIAGEVTEDEAVRMAIQCNPTRVKQIRTQIDDAHLAARDLSGKQWLKERKARQDPRQVLWIYGNAGAGKTSLAKCIGEHESPGSVFVTGSRRDPFQNYASEHTLIIDDLRPETFPYDDLLRILDPYNFDVILPARYHDLRAMIDLTIITTPYDPFLFYARQPEINCKEDNFEQLKRRLTAVIRMDEEEMDLMEPVKEEKRTNYVEVAQAINAVHDLPLLNLPSTECLYQAYLLLTQARPQDKDDFKRIFLAIIAKMKPQKSHQRPTKEADDPADKSTDLPASSSHSGKEE